MNGSTIIFVYFDMFFLKIPTVKNFSPVLRENIAPIHAKIMYYLTIAITNKYLKFHNNWLKIIRLKHNCTEFCPYHSFKEIKINNNGEIF